MRSSVILGALFLWNACSPPPESISPSSRGEPLPQSEPLPVASDAPSASSAVKNLPPPPIPFGFGPATKEEPSNPEDLCEVANSNIRKAIDEVFALPAPRLAVALPVPLLSGSSISAPAKPSHWSYRGKARYDALVEGRFRLRPRERTLLQQNGFVVPARLHHRSFAHAYHDIYQSQLPVFVTMDSLFHAIFVSHEHLLLALEEKVVKPASRSLVGKLEAELKKRASTFSAEIVEDLGLYLAVAHALQEEGRVPENPIVAALVEQARKAESLSQVTIFGRSRMIDFSQYRPRGPYAEHEDLHDHFRAMMWLSRLEFNLVSRSSRSSAPGATPDPSETPREAMAAVALAELVASSGASIELRQIESVWGGLAGKREDVSMEALLVRWNRTGMTSLSAPGGFEALRTAIGQDFQRTARIHYMPQGSAILPAISTMIGPRITPDTAAMRPLVHGEVNDRYELGVADIAYMLGHGAALGYLKQDLKKFPELQAGLGKAREIAQHIDGDDLYSSWLKAIRALTRAPQGAVPSFTTTTAFQDLRMNSIVAAYGQLRRNNTLLAAQGYNEGGCEIPDGYVEPAPEVLDRLIDYEERTLAILHTFELNIQKDLENEFTTIERSVRIFRALRSIVQRQISGEPLAEPERRFLATITEIIPAGSDSPPRYTGWYFQLFPMFWEALKSPGFVGDFYTSVNTGQVSYAGASEPTLGIFVVDTGGEPRLMVGPVAQAFEQKAPLSKRLTDKEGSNKEGKTAIWQKSYTVAAAHEPEMILQQEGDLVEKYWNYKITPSMGKTLSPGSLTIELLSHHRQVCGRGTGSLGPTGAIIKVKRLQKGEEICPQGGIRILWKGQVFTSLDPWSTSAYFGYKAPVQDEEPVQLVR